MMALGFFLFGLLFITPIFVSRILHFDATQTGLLFVPGSLLTALLMPVVGKLLQKVDPRYLILFGFTMVEVCTYSMTQFTSLTEEPQIFWSMIYRGFGMAFLFVPINTTVLSSFKGQELGQVAGLMNLLRQIGGSMGIAMLATLLAKNGHQNYVDLAGKVSLLNPATQIQSRQIIGGMAGKMSEMVGMSTPDQAMLKSLSARLQTQVFVMSFTQVMWIMMIIVAFAAIPIFLLKRPKGPVVMVDSH